MAYSAPVRPDLDQLVRRLRHLPPGAWPERRDAVRSLLVALAGPRPVPDLPDHALADAVAVIGSDAIVAAAGDPDAEAAVTAALQAALTATR